VSDIAPNTPRVDVDRERMLQVFSNLLGNAINFTRLDGRVIVSARPADNYCVEFAVADTGPGIAPDDLPHVFDRYWQAGRKTKSGVGLGLTIAKAIVEAHGGRISAQSVVGEGSQFSFAIPQQSQILPPNPTKVIRRSGPLPNGAATDA
jgi:signal transduction histidine kinase